MIGYIRYPLGVDHINMYCGLLQIQELLAASKMQDVMTRCVTCGIKAWFIIGDSDLWWQHGAMMTYCKRTWAATRRTYGWIETYHVDNWRVSCSSWQSQPTSKMFLEDRINK